MKNLTIILLAICSVLFVACKTKSKATTSSEASAEKTANDPNAGTRIQCRLAISFISFASGIDGAKYDAIEKYIKEHPKKPVFEVIPMGREGERDICLNLKEMNSSEQKDFIKEIKKLAEGSDRVKVMEDTERTKWK